MKINHCYAGDCRTIIPQLVADGIRVQTVVTSPPYWGLRDYGHSDQLGLEPTPEAYVDRLVEVLRALRELLHDDGTLWLNLGDCYATGAGKVGSSPGGGKQGDDWSGRGVPARAGDKNPARANRGPMTQPNRLPIPGLKPKDLVGIPWRVAFALQSDGWWLRQDIIWNKPACMPESVRDRCTKSHEYLFLLTKSSKYYYDAEAIKEPADPKNSRDTTTARRSPPPGKSTDSGFKKGRHFSSRNKRSVWTVPNQPFPGAHFAVFPSKLIEPCILAGSRPGDIVFDPFMGSGTTAMVAQQLGRRWLGCELNPEYVALQTERLQQQSLEL